MPTIFSHPAVPLAIRLGLGSAAVPGRLVAAGVVASVLPDADVLGFALGIPYASDLGHRGISHSLAFAALCGACGALLHRPLRARAATAFAFVFLACASHALLDAFTDGGLGVALFWPLSSDRWFAPVRMIEVAPIGPARMLSLRGAAVLASELRWIWAPSALLALALACARRGARSDAPGRPRGSRPLL